MNKKLVLITAGFPFGTHETFLETEIRYLCEGFEQVTIVAVDPTSDKLRTVPPNCTVVALDAQLSGLEKLLSSLGIFNNRVWQELRIIKKVYRQRVTIGKIKTILISLARAQKIRRKLELLTPLDDQTVLYSYWCDDAALALSMLKKQLPKVKTVSRIHRWDVYFDQSRFNYLPFRRFISDNMNCIFSISEDGINYVSQVWKINVNEKVILSRLGINNFNEIIETTSDGFLMVSCSNVIPVKRVNLIAEALGKISNYQIKWVHFGDGADMINLKKLIATLPNNINVELHGRVPNKEIFEFYRTNKPDLFINVSSSEGVPVSIMEAMSFGIPCIATNVGGNSEIVNERNGKLLVENPTPQEIADAICAFFETTVFQSKSEGAFLTWKEKYNAERNYIAFVEALKAF